jgi:hypothetical protein
MRPGDVIAFSGKGTLCEVVKRAYGSDVSHVAAIFDSTTGVAVAPDGGVSHEIIESTATAGGVAPCPLSERVQSYDGIVWWLPLSQAARRAMDLARFREFLRSQRARPYDVPQAVRSAIDHLDGVSSLGPLTRNVEDFARFFCSELVAAALEASGAIPSLNSSEVTPMDLCRFCIYADDYWQIKGPDTRIEGHNTLSPGGWGE